MFSGRLRAGGALIAGSALLGGCGLPHVEVVLHDRVEGAAAAPATTAPAAPPVGPETPQTPQAPETVRPVKYLHTGKNTWVVAAGKSAVSGSAGPVLRYQVAVERGIDGITAKKFAGEVVKILGDDRSWTGQGERRLRRVGPGQSADFTVRLTTPGTRDVLCGGTGGYTSCRNGDDVVINVARWVHGVPDYPASLAVYRAYVINHETGHLLGHGHELCPGPGRLAPVMQQQSLGMHGCRANAWPSPKGKPLHGSAGEYDDPIPVERTGRN
ncbi:DUF3152 domain-containing protein [Kineosporia rhizophila]|uniref:DUF3152 domain-containing protein n=1 Tax=Kineosporia rhizophila TaxID=84633 RepID=UPI001E30FBFD|nr:DUF3152 domain-containing protein [Kineosporia rhizophila]